MDGDGASVAAPIDFITQFHNLEGDLIGERKKNLFKLILDLSSSKNEEQLNNVVENLKPTSYLENLFRLDILIHFKKTTELVKVLEQGNEVFISKILKQFWFIDEAFRDIDAKIFVNEFLPSLSYAIRMKLVKKVAKCWNETQIDALFDSFSERYGIFLATTILHKCSSNKIKEILNENEIKLKPAQVKYLFDKDEEIFKFYLDYIHSSTNCSYQETKVLNHVALKNPQLLLELQKNKKIRVSGLGRRTSKRIIKLVKDDIPRDVKKYVNMLNNGVIVRKLGGSFGKVYQELLSKKVGNITRYNIHSRMLIQYPKKTRWSFFCDSYLKVFPSDSVEVILSAFDTFLLDLNPGREIIKKWALINYNSNNGDHFLKYFDPSEAIPIIKEKINVTSDISNRTTLVMLLLDCCSTNNDLNSLEAVLKYICFRHRNEDSNFRQRVMSQITSNFRLDDFNENHWKYINEQLKIDRVKKEFIFWMNSTILKKHLEFLFKNGKDHKDALVEYINDVVDSDNDFDLSLENPPVEREILIDISNCVLDVIKGEKADKTIKTVIGNVTDFSMKHAQYCIKYTECPMLLSAIRSCFSKNENFDVDDIVVVRNVLLYNLKFPQNPFPIDNSRLLEVFVLVAKEGGINKLSNIFRERLLKKNRSEFENKILNEYLEKLLYDHLQRYIILWLLKNEPRKLLPHFDNILEIDNSAVDSKLTKLYSHFEFDKKAINFFKKQLESKNRNENLIMANLGVLLSTDDFVALANTFLPKKVKVDLEDPEMMKDYKLQCELAKLLHRVHEPHKTLPVVIKFCIGDYLQSSLSALYGCFYRSPEKMLYPYVEHLATKAVSVRKHAIFLSCEVLDTNEVIRVLKNAKQVNVSDQKHLFSAMLKYFWKNPSQELFKVVVAGIETIDKNDTEAMESLATNIKIPKKYMAEYIEKCWIWFESLSEKGVNIRTYLKALLDYMSDDIVKSFSSEFVNGLLTRYFGTQDVSIDKFMTFTMQVLKHRVLERDNNFKVVFGKLPRLDNNGITTFFTCFINSCRSEERDKEFIDTFVQYWNTHFADIDMFEEKIRLKLLLIELDQQSGKEYAQKVVSLLEELNSLYGSHVFNIFRDQLCESLENLKDIQKYSLYLEILKYKCNPTNCILIIELMKQSVELGDEKEIYEEIMNILRVVDEPIVKIYFKSLVKKE
nr:uncharacterized protein LOC111505841 isoform X2 [Leptinotarsa decemlineata]XP_023016489.1 uncharacterized protein LOC111505841 isoform X2 [Leptinotarsa decemlineata]